jgi:hypothetical protein
LSTYFVVLTDVEKSWANQWATAIYDATTKQNLHDARVDPNTTSLDMDIIGFSGELAFAKLINQFPSTDTDGPSHVDCTVCGKTVDVKTTKRDNGQLLVRPSLKGSSAELFVLLTGTPETGYKYRGFMPASEVFQQRYLTDLGHGPTYVVPQHLLKQGLPDFE